MKKVYVGIGGGSKQCLYFIDGETKKFVRSRMEKRI
jgi:hypothetical protein